MSDPSSPGSGVGRRLPLTGRLPLIGGAVALMVAGILVVSALLTPDRVPAHPPPVDTTAPHPPIAHEVDVYRLGQEHLAVSLDVAPRAASHPRTQATFRSLRAYPGAPPRIPHGLTPQEFMGTHCNSCHERGGFVPRFSTYAPVTPHPEWSECLQCHAPDAMTVGLGIPMLTTDVICGQCHVDPDRPPPTLVALDWVTTAWPATGQQAMDGAPPAIPHDLQYRGNCLACHGGPSSLQGIRTPHPGWTDCRSCHAGGAPSATPEADVFTRPLDPTAPGAGGGP